MEGASVGQPVGSLRTCAGSRRHMRRNNNAWNSQRKYSTLRLYGTPREALHTGMYCRQVCPYIVSRVTNDLPRSPFFDVMRSRCGCCQDFFDFTAPHHIESPAGAHQNELSPHTAYVYSRYETMKGIFCIKVLLEGRWVDFCVTERLLVVRVFASCIKQTSRYHPAVRIYMLHIPYELCSIIHPERFHTSAHAWVWRTYFILQLLVSLWDK